MRKPALLVSAGIHVAVLLLLLTVAAVRSPLVMPPHKTVMPLSIRYYPPQPEPPGGAGQQPAEPAPEAPATRPAPRIFRPQLLAVNDQPQLPVQMTLAEDPGLSVHTAGVGEFLGIPGNGGTGLTGLAGPPGPGAGRGAGPGTGDGFGSGSTFTGKITRAPQVIYKEEPEYSEDARKAHIQGTVRLYIDVGLDGRATNIRLVRGVGLGLDENAIEAVRKWRFRPALSGDKPVVAPAVVDVGFFLL